MSGVTHTIDDVRPGDYIAYPAILRPEHHDVRTVLCVTRIEGGKIIGKVQPPNANDPHPERIVFPVQLVDNGVLVYDRVERPPP